MTRNDQENAVHKIDGHLSSLPGKGVDAKFTAAKEECLRNLRRDIEHVEAITPEMFWGKHYQPDPTPA